MAYPDAVAIEAAAAKGKTDLSGTPQGGGARAQGSSKRIKQSDTRPRNVGNVANPVLLVDLGFCGASLGGAAAAGGQHKIS